MDVSRNEEMMFKEEFIKRLYDTIVDDEISYYRKEYNSTIINDKTHEFTIKSLDLYNSLSVRQKEFFFDIIRTVMIDTLSGVFGVIDGSTGLNGGNMDIKMYIEGEDTEEELQDTFLEFVENLEKNE